MKSNRGYIWSLYNIWINLAGLQEVDSEYYEKKFKSFFSKRQSLLGCRKHVNEKIEMHNMNRGKKKTRGAWRGFREKNKKANRPYQSPENNGVPVLQILPFSFNQYL